MRPPSQDAPRALVTPDLFRVIGQRVAYIVNAASTVLVTSMESNRPPSIAVYRSTMPPLLSRK